MFFFKYIVKIYQCRLKLKVTPEEEFFGSDLSSHPDFLSYQPPRPTSGKNFQFAIHQGDVLFLE